MEHDGIGLRAPEPERQRRRDGHSANLPRRSDARDAHAVHDVITGPGSVIRDERPGLDRAPLGTAECLKCRLHAAAGGRINFPR